MTVKRLPLHIISTLVVLVAINFLAVKWDIRMDLTPDNRYSIGKEAAEILKSNDEYFVITVLLEGNVPPSFKAYRQYLDYYLQDVKAFRQNVAIVYRNPNEGSVEEINSFRAFLRSYGVNHLSRQVRNEAEITESVIYPYISVHNERRVEFIDLLESRNPSESEQSAIIRSMGTFEEKFFKAVRNISRARRHRIAVFDKDQNGLASVLNGDIKLSNQYLFEEYDSELLLSQRDSIDALICLVDQMDFDPSEVLAIDQTIMAGTPCLWVVNKVDATIENIRDADNNFLATAFEHRAEDMLFKWGVKVNPDIVSDLSCSPIPQVTGRAGGQSQTTMINYPFHVLAKGSDATPISQGIQDIIMQFPSSLDTIISSSSISKSPLIQTSIYSKSTLTPFELNFDFLRSQPNPSEYDESNLTLGVLLEGSFDSYLVNRINAQLKSELDQQQRSFIATSPLTTQMVFADLSFILPPVLNIENPPPLGFDRWSRRVYEGNRIMIENGLDYMIHGENLSRLRRQEIAIGALDLNRFNANLTYYYSILFLIPLVAFSLFISILYAVRKRQYG